MRKLRTGSCRRSASRGPSARCSTRSRRCSRRGLDAAWARAPNPGARPLARLNRTEYANAIRDLLGVRRERDRERAAARRLRRRFDNNASALGVSPTLLEGYATAAMQISRRAVGDRTMGHGETRYTAVRRRGAARADRGLAARHARRPSRRAHVPARCEYEFVVSAAIPAAGWDNPTGRSSTATGRPSTSRSTARPSPSTNPRRFRLRVPAGPQRITVALVDERALRRRQRALSGRGRARRRRSGADDRRPVRFDGRRRHAEPARDLRLPARLGRRRRRRAPSKFSRGSRRARIAVPVTPGGDELARAACSFYRTWDARRAATSRSASNTRCRACSSTRGSSIDSSASPPSLPSAPSTAIDDSRARVAAVVFSLEQHSGRRAARARGGGPAARAGSARGAGRAHARRTSARRRSSRISRANGCCCASSMPSCRRIRISTRILRAAFRRETELLFADVLRERRSVLDRCSTRITRILNERLAAHYGIDGVRGSHMRRVAWPPDSPRRGAARARQHSHGDVGAESHVARRARPVDHAELARREGADTRRPAPRPISRRKPANPRSSSATRCASAWSCIAPIRPARLATASWTRSALRSRTSILLGRWRDNEDGHADRCLGATWSTAQALRGPRICAARC